MNIKTTLILLGLLCASLASFASPLPASTPNGILTDRVLPMAHLEDLDGSPTAPAVNLPRWRQTVHELSRSAEAPLGWPTSRELEAKPTGRNQIPLAVVWSQYDRLDSEKTVQPALAFAFTPLKMNTHDGQALKFSLDQAHILENRRHEVVGWWIDASDGAGWQELIPGHDLPVSYATVGSKTLRLRADLPDGSQLQAAALLHVKRLDTPEPTETWAITATESFEGAVATGQAYVYLADGHSQLTNPVVVVEGFDLDNTMDWPVLYELLNQENMLEDLRAHGYDTVVLDFTEATEPIQRNAFVLTELLSRVQTAAGEETSVAVVGASMGGLVSRYALTWLENENLEHHVRTFVSFDSPQNGANIPLGLQYWLNFFKDESVEAAFLLSRLNRPAARQMLLYHYTDPPSSSPSADPMMAAYRNDLAALGDWPQQPHLVAVANGSGLGADQGFAAGDRIIDYEYRSLLADIDGNVWAVSDGGTQMIFDGLINLIWPLPDTEQTVTVSGTLPWDNAPGGSRGSMAQMDDTEAPYGDIVAVHDSHCFVPTISALGLEVSDPFFDIDHAPDLLALTNFDAVYYPAENQGHVVISPENKVWLLQEIQTGISGVDDTPVPLISGPVLYPASPNPFNPQTEISFSLIEPAVVTLKVFDLAGREVRTLAAGQSYEAGHHALNWSGTNNAGQTQPSGVYFYRLETRDGALVRTMTMVK